MLLTLGLIVLLTTVVTEVSARRGWVPYWVARKVLHFVAVICCAVAALTVERGLLIGIVAGAEVLLVVLILGNRLMREESGRRAWGIVLFPLAFLFLLVTEPDEHLIAFGMLVLAVCDPAATVAGKIFAGRHYELTGDPKSWVGNLGFLLAFGLLVGIHWPFGSGLGVGNLVLVGLLLTVAEALGSKGLDNLVLPPLAVLLFDRVGELPGYTLPVLVLGGAAFVYLAVRRGSLTAGGALTAALLGVVVVVGTGSLGWLWPLFFFLGSSSLLERLFPSPAVDGDLKEGKARDATQVLANGAVYGWLAAYWWPSPDLIYVVYPPTEWILLALMAAATADTWASVIGRRFGGMPFDLRRMAAGEAGLSGGVSWAGTLGAGLGSVGAVAATFWLPNYSEVGTLALVAGLGFVGMLLDSLLGAFLQARYRDAAGRLTDRPGPGHVLVGGYAWLTNDGVNALTLGLTALLAGAVLPMV